MYCGYIKGDELVAVKTGKGMTCDVQNSFVNPRRQRLIK